MIALLTAKWQVVPGEEHILHQLPEKAYESWATGEYKDSKCYRPTLIFPDFYLFFLIS
jgi:hypothetical protein